MLKELVDLLTCRELDAEELASLTAAIENAGDDPDLDWLDDPSPEELIQNAIVFKLVNHLAVGDKVDEVHQQISDFFAEPLADFPRYANGRRYSPDDYFVWLDPLLAERGQHGGGYRLLLLDDSFSEQLNALLVWRKDTARVLELAGELGLAIESSTQRSPGYRAMA
ncbi:hypothetical protein [Lysobacter enzymogenes]|uniref:hypothetical protein n=1 Tax=Lysobacter enzymogenes TaxID=69 RepID=UPI001A9597BB|nr:hypothetical protein [Lysobacter enzymogenes]QQP98667.1 hypothetical protein JHW38_12080 [Lysobacter enzymogenes]